jgi:hypothetical protein
VRGADFARLKAQLRDGMPLEPWLKEIRNLLRETEGAGREMERDYAASLLHSAYELPSLLDIGDASVMNILLAGLGQINEEALMRKLTERADVAVWMVTGEPIISTYLLEWWAMVRLARRFRQVPWSAQRAFLIALGLPFGSEDMPRHPRKADAAWKKWDKAHRTPKDITYTQDSSPTFFFRFNRALLEGPPIEKAARILGGARAVYATLPEPMEPIDNPWRTIL